MESSSAKPSVGPPPNPLLPLSTFFHRVGTQLATRLDDAKRFAGAALLAPPPLPRLSLPFASVSQRQGKQAAAPEASFNSEHVARRLSGTSVYTVSNTNNEFVLISDPDGVKSIGLLCFRREDAEAFLAQVRSRRGEVKGGAKVVPITLDQVYMLKVEGIAFRFLPDPVQIKNALEIRASDVKSGFDGVPVFQSDLLVVKKKNKRYCPIYFQKEDIEKALSTVSRASRGPGLSQHILVGSLEDVLRKMEISKKNSGWEDLIFIPPGKSHSQHIQEVVKL
ncbi:protein TIC 22, chloroplastic isoform X1 [Salvia miltiorrhiza]|uniref:protein TIC 22, chloroplastic isoform X1 n=1 Tax=Salvia miltiorrhiza TaxID=226208 RepID=UPI0025ABBE3D|nr:protein TIC 22, chloroplastic isoform X1 [Salvia miltiorrhiza]XP_057794509.1 protein TIC 22, chloroplastic isoform X1 [Salvia miltiorrhiza]